MKTEDIKVVHLGLSKPQQKVYSSIQTRNLFMAGIGSGKSHVAAPICMIFISQFPYIRGFIGANTYSQLSKSTLSRIFDMWENYYGLVKDIDYVVDKMPPDHFKTFGSRLKKYDNTISFDNGHLIFLSSLENYTSIDGTEFGYAILDETKDTREAAVKEVITTRLRQPGIYKSDNALYDQDTYNQYMIDGQFKNIEITGEDGLIKKVIWNVVSDSIVEGFNPMFIFTSPAKVDWINEWFGINQNIKEISSKIFSNTDFYYAEKSNYSVTISSTFHNEHNLSPGFIDGLIKSYEHNPQLIEMLVYGSPIAKSGGEWFSRFDRRKHVKKLTFNNEYPIHLSIDENVVPYMTMLVSQFIEEDDIIYWRTYREYCLPNPKNNAESLCGEFLVDYNALINGLFYTGDASSKKRSTLRRGNEHIYDVIDECLEDYVTEYSRNVLKKNPSLATCRDFFNRMLNNGYKDIIVEIDDSCVNLIADMEYLKEDPKGGYKKEMTTDTVTGETYQKYGHCADAWRYQGVTAFPNKFKRTK